MKNKIKFPVLIVLIVLAGIFFVSAYSDYEDDDEFNTLVITDFEGVGYIRDTTVIWDGRTVDGGNILRPDIPLETGTTTISFRPLSEQ